jgi:DNA-binding NarL/FixJ family response regulator
LIIVDDNQDWLRQISQMLRVRSDLQILCQVSDGSDAVQKAGELKPNLILLDIGLPKLNGIEAARQIRHLSPSSKIIFLSQDNSFDVVQEAMSVGGRAYVHKAHTGSELIPAIDSVLRGERFVSSSIKGHELLDTPGAVAPHHHEVLFYSDDEVFLARVTRFLAAALIAGDAVAMIARHSHRESFLHRLKAQRLDVDRAIQQGTFVSLDAAETLSTIMVNGLPDPVRFLKIAGGFVEAAAKATNAKRPRITVFGEAVDLLQAEGKTDAAIRIEQLWNDLAKTHELNILCSYALNSFHGEEDGFQFQSICAEHSAVCS